jgi:hypothetical protein
MLLSLESSFSIRRWSRCGGISIDPEAGADDNCERAPSVKGWTGQLRSPHHFVGQSHNARVQRVGQGDWFKARWAGGALGTGRTTSRAGLSSRSPDRRPCRSSVRGSISASDCVLKSHHAADSRPAELTDDPARQPRHPWRLDRCDNAQLDCNSRLTTSLAVSRTEVRPTGSRVLGLSGRCLFEPGA